MQKQRSIHAGTLQAQKNHFQQLISHSTANYVIQEKKEDNLGIIYTKTHHNHNKYVLLKIIISYIIILNINI